MAKKSSAPTKSDILAAIAKETGLSKKQVGSVFEALGPVIKKSLKGYGLFTLPGLAKMKVVKKPATKAREGVNPFTGDKMVFKAKPASKKVRVMPLKNLTMRRITEGTSVYFIGEVGISGAEILVFDIDAAPGDQSGKYSVQFKREFFAG